MFSLMLAIMSETNFIESKNKQKYAENSNGFHLITVILLKDILQFLHFKTAWSFLFLYWTRTTKRNMFTTTKRMNLESITFFRIIY